MKQILKATAAVIGMIAAVGLSLFTVWLFLWISADLGFTM